MSPRRTVKVLLDTNFLMLPIRFNVDILKELDRLIEGSYQIFILQAIIDEIKKIKSDAKPSLAKELDFALKYANNFSLIDVKMSKEELVDDHIQRVANEYDYVVASTDSKLRSRLRASGISVIYLKQGSHLAIDGPKPL